MSHYRKELNLSADPYIAAWQQGEMRELHNRRKTIKRVMALGAATAALATGTAAYEGQTQEAVEGGLGATVGLTSAGVLARRKHEGEIAHIEKVGDRYVAHQR